jgi:hypothetical protein
MPAKEQKSQVILKKKLFNFGTLGFDALSIYICIFIYEHIHID